MRFGIVLWLAAMLFSSFTHAGLTVDATELNDSINATIGNAEALDRQRSAEAAERWRESGRSEYEASHPTCQGSANACYSITAVSPSGRRVSITCTHGSRSGQKVEVCGNDKGRWASGCGFTDAFAHHYHSVKSAARQACDL